MPDFSGLPWYDQAILAVRNAWANSTGTYITPAQLQVLNADLARQMRQAGATEPQVQAAIAEQRHFANTEWKAKGALAPWTEEGGDQIKRLLTDTAELPKGLTDGLENFFAKLLGIQKGPAGQSSDDTGPLGLDRTTRTILFVSVGLIVAGLFLRR